MSLAEDDLRLQALINEQSQLEGRAHQGYADMSRLLKLQDEIEAIEQDRARQKQIPRQGEG